MTLGEMVKALMDERGMDVKRLAEVSGVPFGTITNLLWRGNTTVREKTAQKLAAALGVDTEVFRQFCTKPPIPQKDQLCWTCKNALPRGKYGCNWSRWLKPVDGWTATPTKRGYYITACPQYIKEKTNGK